MHYYCSPLFGIIHMESDFQGIETSVCDRNRLRRRSGLPLLDEEREIARTVAVLKWNERQTAINVHMAVYLKLRQEVLHAMRSERGDNFPLNSFSHCLLIAETERRFRKYLLSIGMVDLPTPCIPSL